MKNYDENNLVISEAEEYQYLENEDIYHVEIKDNVTKIDNGAFSKCSNLKSVKFPCGLEIIEQDAFNECENLEEVILPNSIKKIGSRAFADCKRLRKIVIPEGCEEIDWGAFAGCENLEEIILPNSIKILSPQLFLNCKKLKTVSLPLHINSLPDEVFKGCQNLDIKLNSNIIKLGDKVFENCYKLNHYPTQIIEAGIDSFRNCRSLQDVILNEKMKYLPDGMFDGCINLSNIYYLSNENLDSGKRCFRNCRSLKSIPNFIRNYSERLFENCTGLESIDITDSTIPMACFRGCSNIRSINNQEKIKKMEAFAFSGCSNIEEFTITSLADDKIAAEAFSHCKRLRKINSKCPIRRIGARAFYDCPKLEDNDFIDTAEHIGKEAFRYCHGIKKIVIPEKLKVFGDYAFSSMNSLERIEVAENNDTFMTPDNKILIHKITQKLMLYASGLKDRSYSLKDYNYRIDSLGRDVVQPIDGIGVGAFAGAKNLEEITICGCTRNLEYTAFEECDNLEKLIFQSIPFGTSFFLNVRDHGKYYVDEYAKKPLEIPFKTVEFCGEEPSYIEDNALNYFNNVEEIILPERGIHSIYPRAFADCKLTKLKVPRGVSFISSDSLPKGITVSFDNGLSFDNFRELSLNTKYNKDYKLYTLEDGTYHIELGDSITKLTQEDIDKVCTHSEKLRNDPVLYLDFMNDLFKNDLALKEFFNGILFCNLSLDSRKLFLEYMDKEDKFSCNVITESDILESDDFYTQYLLEKKNFKIVMDYIELFRKYDVTNPLFYSKVLMTYYNLDNCEDLLKNHYDILEKIFQNGDLLKVKKEINKKEADASLEKLILENNYLKVLIDYLEKYGLKDRFLFKKPIIAITNNELGEEFFKYFDANLKRLIKKSQVLDNYSTAKDNLEDLLILLKITGAFEDDSIIRQKACTFISDNIFEEKINDENNPCRVVGDDIHRIFHFYELRDEFNQEFVDFFMNNFKELMKCETEKSGFIERVYLNFKQISNTCTSNKGEQRKLKVTIEKCKNYLNATKFDGVNPEDKKFAATIGEWFDENETWLTAKRVYNDALAAPRNIFVKIEYDEDGNPIYDYNPSNDLKEEISTDYSYEWLPKQDYDNLILGKYCSCCAHLRGAGYGIMRASMISDSCQNLVIRDNLGAIIAKSTLYVNRDAGYAVFNNIEASKQYRDDNQLKKIYSAFMRGAKAFFDTYNMNNDIPLNEIVIGLNRNVVSDYLDDIKHPKHELMECIPFGTYTDDQRGGHYNGDCHTSQRLVLKK